MFSVTQVCFFNHFYPINGIVLWIYNVMVQTWGNRLKKKSEQWKCIQPDNDSNNGCNEKRKQAVWQSCRNQ